MSDELRALLDRAASDPDFLARFRADPVAAAKSAGLGASESDIAEAARMFGATQARAGIEALKPRVSRMAIPIGVVAGTALPRQGHGPGSPAPGHAVPTEAGSAPTTTSDMPTTDAASGAATSGAVGNDNVPEDSDSFDPVLATDAGRDADVVANVPESTGDFGTVAPLSSAADRGETPPS
jgi:hypothetical protein